MTRDLRTLIYLLNLELREECSRTLGPVCNRGAAVEADAIGRAAVQAGAVGEQQLAGREAEANGEREQQWKRMAQSGPGAAVEADAAIGPGSRS